MAIPQNFRPYAAAGVALAGASLTALAIASPTSVAHADTGTWDFQLPTLVSAPGDYTYEVPDYQADGSWTPVTIGTQSMNVFPGPAEVRYVDLDHFTGWGQIHLGALQIDSFYSPLMVDGVTYPQSVAQYDDFLFNLGGNTLFGWQWDSAHDVVNVLGAGGVDLFSIPENLGYGASLSDVIASSAGAISPLELGNLFSWL